MTLDDLYFNQGLVNDNTILHIMISENETIHGHWYEYEVSIAIYQNKDRIIDTFTYVSRFDGSELIIKLRDDYILPY